MTTDASLLYLVAALGQSDKLRHEFETHPAEVFRKHPLSDEDRAILRRRNIVEITDRIKEEAMALIREITSPSTANIPWPDPFRPQIESCKPPRAGVGQTVFFTVVGNGYSKDASLALSFIRPDAHVEATDVAVEPSGTGNSILTGKAIFSTPGLYDVQVTVTVGDESQTMKLAQAFEATMKPLQNK